MPILSQAECEKIRETETLKGEIRRELEPKNAQSAFSRFFSHAAVLLILGFALTGVVGGTMTSCWKKHEADNQRVYLERQRLLQRKYEILGDVVKSVAQTTTATEDVLANYSWNTSKTIMTKRNDDWEKSSEGWRISSKILKPNLRIYFHNPLIYSTFDDIVRKRRRLGIDVTNLMSPDPDPKVREHEAETLQKEALNLVNEMLSELDQVECLMAKELNSDK